MKRSRMTSGSGVQRGVRAALCGIVALLAVACSSDDDPVVVGPGNDVVPEITEVRTIWVEEGWSELEPVGTPGVQLFWELPDDWDGEVFRVYSRGGSTGDYFPIATVTSCAEGQCVYTDTNVEPGQTYGYFIVAVDEGTDEEVGESEVRDVTVPSGGSPDVPTGLTAVALDSAVYVRWESVEAAKYRVFLEGVGDEEVFFEVGATDGLGYVDFRTENGTAHTYRVAAVSEEGWVSSRSEAVSAIPRPDYHAELIFTTADSVQASGFRFATSGNENPILAGSSDDAQWRLELESGALRIVPVNGARVTGGTFTTDLSCGPGSESDCLYVDEAPAASEFGTTPVEVSAGNTYVFEVTHGGETHFGKIRVHGDAVDSAGRRLLVFDWAFQLMPGEPSLNVAPSR